MRFKPKREVAKAAQGIESPYGIEARFRNRCGVCWTGCIVHLSETCEDEDCQRIVIL